MTRTAASPAASAMPAMRTTTHARGRVMRAEVSSRLLARPGLEDEVETHRQRARRMADDVGAHLVLERADDGCGGARGLAELLQRRPPLRHDVARHAHAALEHGHRLAQRREEQ